MSRRQQDPLAREEQRDDILGDGGVSIQRSRSLVNYGDVDVPRGDRAATEPRRRPRHKPSWEESLHLRRAYRDNDFDSF